MSRPNKIKQKSPSPKRVPAPKQRREPLPISISVKHHLPVSADGTATDLTVAELEATARTNTHQSLLDYLTSQVSNQIISQVGRSLSPTMEGSIPRSESRSETRSEVRSDSRAETRSDARIENRPELRPETRSDARLEARSDPRSNPRSELNSEDQSDLRSGKMATRDQFDHPDLHDQDLGDSTRRNGVGRFNYEDQHVIQKASRSKEAVALLNDLNDLDGFDDDLADLDTIEVLRRAQAAKASNSSKNSLKKQARANDRKVEDLNFKVDNKFVRVPNAIADQLARQLSPAEEKIFDQLWRLTVGFNRDLWRGKISDLMIRTGYSSRATVTKAIAGLLALGLILVEGRDTNPRGRSYRIIDRSQLVNYAHKSREVEQSIKKLTTTHAESSRLVESRTSDLLKDLQETKAPKGSDQSASRAFKNSIDKHDNSSSQRLSSSSCEDDEKASQIRLIYQDLTGNSWSKIDEASYQELSHIPLPFAILGICYSITRAADHHIGSLKYCLPSIKEHFEMMRAFPSKDLLEIAYRHIVRVKEAQRNGKWRIQE